MDLRASDRYLGMYVLLASVAVCLLVSPFNSMDAFNLTKLCLLVVLSFIAAGLAFSNTKFFKIRRNRVILLMIGWFILQLIFVLLFDNREFSYKFYGAFGRNTGFIAYLSLTFLLFSGLMSASRVLLKRYVVAISVTGAILALYGIAQSRGYEFYQVDLGAGTNTFGTFGNSNFQSAFMGIAATVTVTLFTFSKSKIHIKVGLFVVTCLAIYNISLSSQQGYFNFAAGIAASTVIYLLKSKKPIFGWIALVGALVSALLVLFGILNLGPLAQFIYKSSLFARSFYWRAAVNMILEHPFFGVGMDGFGDSYLRSRPANYYSVGFFSTSNTAHNIPLDIGSNGGFALLIAYLAITFYVIISVVRVMKRNTEFDVVFTTIAAAWVAYQAQSLISINQLGLGVWGWSLSGLIIGYELNTRSDYENHKQITKNHKEISTQKISAQAVLTTFVMSFIGISIAAPPYIAEGKFYKALQSGDADVIQSAAYLKPYEQARFAYVAQILQKNKLEPRAIKVLQDATELYPDSIELWRKLAEISTATASNIAQAKAEMKRLDPHNPDH